MELGYFPLWLSVTVIAKLTKTYNCVITIFIHLKYPNFGTLDQHSHGDLYGMGLKFFSYLGSKWSVSMECLHTITYAVNTYTGNIDSGLRSSAKLL